MKKGFSKVLAYLMVFMMLFTMVPAMPAYAETEGTTDPAAAVTETENDQKLPEGEGIEGGEKEIIEEEESVQQEQTTSADPSAAQSRSSSNELATGTCGDDLTWTLTTDGVLTISGTGAMYDYDASPWFEYNDTLKTLVLEEGITHIGDYAFSCCTGFTGDLVIPDGVKSIGTDAFSECTGFNGGLTLPAGLTTIGDFAFHCCSNLTGTLTIPESVTEIGEFAFAVCSGFNGNLVLSEGLTSIGNSAFSECYGFTGNLTIPDSVTSIGTKAFHWCKGFNGTLTLSEKLTSISNNAFQYCENLAGELIIPDGITSIGESAFYKCGFTGTAAIPESVAAIGSYAFNECSGLEVLKILNYNCEFSGSITNCSPAIHGYPSSTAQTYATENSLTFVSIDEDVLATGSCGDNATWTIYNDGVMKIRGKGEIENTWSSYSGSIKKLVIGDGITNIPESGFRDYKIESIEIAGSVKEIEKLAFYECDYITEDIVLQEGLETIGEGAFAGCTSVQYITLPEGVTTIGDYAFRDCWSLKEMVLPGTVTSIGTQLLCGCIALESFDIPDWMTSIPANMFDSCTSLKTIEIPASVTTIEACAFYNCTGLEELVLPESVTTLGTQALQGFAGTLVIMNSECGNLDNLLGLDSGAVIKGYTGSTAETFATEYDFEFIAIDGETNNCCGENAIWTIDADGNLTISGTGAITDNSGFKDLEINEVVIEEGITAIGNEIFRMSSMQSLAPLPSTLESIGDYAFDNCNLGTELVLPENLTSIGSYAFTNTVCSSVVIPASLKVISEGAFANSMVSYVTIPEGVTTIGDNAFSWTSLIGEVTIPATVTAIGTDAFAVPETVPSQIEYVVVLNPACEIELAGIPTTAKIVGYGQSAAEAYAKNITGITFVYLCDYYEKEHEFGEGTVVQEADCTNQGITEFVCKNCSMQDYKYTGIDEEKHSFGEWEQTAAPTCITEGTESRTCTICDAVETRTVDTVGHTEEVIPEVAATCTKTGLTEGVKCSVCDEVLTAQEEVPKTDHSYGDWMTDVSATCTNVGSDYRVCGVCGATDTRTVEAFGHDYGTVITAPTCETAGYTTYTCGTCGDSYTADEVVKLGHDYVGEITTTATCTTDGVKIYTCQNDVSHTYTEAIPATGHNYEPVVTKPTCEGTGYTTYTCECGDSYVADEVMALGHTWSDWIEDAAATCTSDGTEHRTCGTCGVTEEETINKFGHDYKSVVTEADCTNDGYTTNTCSRCDDSYIADEVDALGHDYESAVTEPDCTNDGYTTNTCSRCNDSYISDETDALGHTEEAIPAVDATCTSTGLSEGVKCSVCGEILTAQDEVDSLGHDYEAVVTAPTCTENGYTTYTCSRCSDSYVGAETDMLGHTEETIPAVDATCTSIGLTEGVKCSVCGEILTAPEEVPMKAHEFGDWITDIDATCTATGSDYRECADCDATETREVAKLGHNYKSAVTTAATCTTDGVLTYTCQNDAGHTYTEVIPATGHAYNAAVTKPTCETAGYTTYTCGTCGDSYKADEVAKLNHNYASKVTTAATCTTAGVMTYTCQNDAEHTYTEAIPATGHAYKAVVTKPTCETAGYTTYTCGTCGDSYKADEKAKLGHNYKSAVTTAATCTTAGVMTYTCQRDAKHTYTEAIAATGHTPGIAATCANPQVCTVCDEILAEATGAHTYGSYKVTKKATFGKAGIRTATCTACSGKKEAAIAALKTPTLSAAAYTYNGKAKTPAVTVKASSGAKIGAANYTVKYASGRKNVGAYKVTVTMKGQYYTGYKTLYFKINPKGASGVKASAAKKAFTVKWTKASAANRKQMTGYQIRYSTSAKMKSAKTVTVKSTTAKSKKISKLKSKKYYYVQVRTYKKIGKVYYYSGWSAVKKVKTK